MRKIIIAGGLALSVASAALLATATASQAVSTQPSRGIAIANGVFQSSDPQAAYAALSSSDRAQFDSVELENSTSIIEASPGTLTSSDGTVTTVEASTTDDGQAAVRPAAVVSPSFTGTFTGHDRWGAKAAAGNTLYTWYQATRVDILKGKVTKVTVFNYGSETSTPGWRTAGTKPSSYNAGWEGRGLLRANFILGAGPWDISHPNECGQIRLNADANHYRYSTSCDLN